ncbi:MAG: HNH endonuclease, partial [Planctomycetes bacterium]|nr:HNH endonuclease [Planctomycetota bacterium]
KGRRGLHAHHVVWRKHGGATTAENLVTLCARCHTLVHEDFLDVDVAHGAAARGGPRFVFRDAHARPIERRDRLGVRPLAQCALDAQPERPDFDVRWLAAHLDWFDARGGRLTLRSQFRESFAAVFGPRAPHGVIP